MVNAAITTNRAAINMSLIIRLHLPKPCSLQIGNLAIVKQSRKNEFSTFSCRILSELLNEMTP